MKKYDLSGVWNFCLDGEKKGIENAYYSTLAEDTITMPNTTALAKKGTYNTNRETGFLTEEYPFSGYAWYQKTVTLTDEEKDRTVKLFLERTRVTKVWVNNEFAGTYDSLCTPHEYDLTDYINQNTVTITVMVDNSDYATKGGHLTSPDTQTNWNGIIGEISLRVYDSVYISRAKAFPMVEDKKVKVCYDIINKAAQQEVEVYIKADEIFLQENEVIRKNDAIKQQSQKLIAAPGKTSVEVIYDVAEASLWSEYHPVYYEMHIGILGNDEDITVPFGLRTFKAQGRSFYINGKKTFLRGKHDGMLFPLTGACPTDVAEWLRIMGISKSYGINHYRYHTCCPPDAAFVAADLLGIYMEPELPFWGSLVDRGEEGYNEKEQEFLVKEGFRMMEAFANHPSYCMMSLGNELWGSSKRMAEILRAYKKEDRRHLYTEGSNNFQFTPVILDEDDFYVGVRFSKERLIRGSYGMCDKPLGFVQTDAPNSIHSYDDKILPEAVSKETGNSDEIIEIQYGTGTKKVKAAESIELIPKKPVVSHEIGQYVVYPNFKEIEEYTGPLKARNFEVFRERLDNAGLLDLADDYFKCSGHLSVECYKLELEAAHRSKNLAGYQILDIQDFSGQGTALVGILDACMNSKGLVTSKRWRTFCSDAVIMAGFSEFSLEAGALIVSDIVLSYYREEALIEKNVKWALKQEDKVLESGAFVIHKSECGVETIGQISFALPDVLTTTHCTFSIEVEETDIANQYELTIHPALERQNQEIRRAIKELDKETTVVIDGKELYITREYDLAVEKLKDGQKVLLIPSLREENSIEGQYCTDFWCYSMFKGISEWMKRPIPVGTLGVLNKEGHKALQDFSCKRYATPQWYHLVMNSRLAILDSTKKELRPIVQMIDNFERNHKLGLLFEAKAENGSLMVCTSDLSKGMDYADVVQFTKSILTYMAGDDFNPSYVIEEQELRQIIC